MSRPKLLDLCCGATALRSLHATMTGTGWMLDHFRQRLTAWGGPWVLKHYDVVQAIPPAYAQFIGEQIAAQLAVAA